MCYTADLMRRALLCFFALALIAPSAHAAGRNKLSKRAQLRYEDVVVVRDGTRWRGKIIAKGDLYRIRLDDGSEVAVPKGEVEAVTRELHPGNLHNGQWVTNAALGAEIAVQIKNNAGATSGAYVEASLGHNFGGTFEPEAFVALTPIGPDETWIANSVQFGAGAKIYLTPNRKAKPFTETLIIFGGSHYDIGLRSGPGLLWDLSEGFGIGFAQGFTLMVLDEPEILAIGYHASITVQARF